MDSESATAGRTAPGAELSGFDTLSVIGHSTSNPPNPRVSLCEEKTPCSECSRTCSAITKKQKDSRIGTWPHTTGTDTEPRCSHAACGCPDDRIGAGRAVSSGSYYFGLHLLTATLQQVLEAIWNTAANQSTVTSVCPTGSIHSRTSEGELTIHLVTEPANAGRTPRVNKGRTPGAFLRDTSSKLNYAANEFRSLEKWERDSYRFASAVISAVREGCSDPYTVISSRWRGALPIYPPRPVLPFRGSAEQFYKNLDARLSQALTFEGRTAQEILDRIVSYLEREGHDPRRGPQHRLSFNSYRAAVLLVKSAQLLPQEFIRTESAELLPFGEKTSATKAESVRGDHDPEVLQGRTTAVNCGR